MAGNTVYVSGNYVDVHDNEVVNLSIDKAGEVRVEKKMAEEEVAEEADKRQPSDADVVDAVRRCQEFFWGSSSWAVVFRILQAYYEEQRSVSQFEAALFELSGRLSHRCTTGCVKMALTNNPVLRSKPEAWEREGASRRILTLRDNFHEVLEAVLRG